MTSTARTALGCAAALVLAAGAVVAVRAADDPSVEPTAAVAVTSPPTSAAGKTTGSADTATPTLTAVGPYPLSVDVVTTAAPRPGGAYLTADVPVELSSVCEGASLQLTDAVPVYSSLQTAAAPLRYLDVALAVYEDADGAAQAYDELVTAVSACPVDRTITPTQTPASTTAPTPSGVPASPIFVHGESSEASIGTRSALQWIQLQTVDEPPTQLRTAVTVTVVDNVLIMVSVDEDSETATAEQVSAASLEHATVLTERLAAEATAG